MCHSVPGRWNTAESTVGTLMVVAMAPVIEHLAYFRHAVENVPIQHFSTHRAVEAFDQRVLCGLPWLDEARFDQIVLRPLSQGMTD